MYTGLMFKFPVNRPLEKQERRDYLDPKMPTASEPMGQYAIIKMNSTYLECVDKFFAFKGFLSFVSLAGGAIMVFVAGLLAWGTISDISSGKIWLYSRGAAISTVFVSLLVLVVLLVLLWGLHQEFFRYTHYPIRFNRKNKKVYVFRTNGTVLTANWADIYFTLGMGRSDTEKLWDVRGHILDADGVTVRETFSTPHTDGKPQTPKEKANPTLTSFWEFARRYMEGNDQDREYLLTKIDDLTNVSDRKETYGEGLLYLTRAYAGGHAVGLIFAPFAILFSPFRWLAMQTCKIPKWSAEIEAECAVDPNDPYLCDEDHPPPKAS